MKKLMYYILICSFFMQINSQDQEVIEIIKQDKEAMQATLFMIDAILKNIQQLLVIIQSSPEIPQKIERWGRLKVFTHWPQETNWNSFSRDLQKLIKELVAVKAQAVQAKEYKYLAHILAKEDLSNKLIKLQDDLDNFVPKIIIPEIGEDKIEAESKKALQGSINALVSILYSDSVLSQFDEI